MPDTPPPREEQFASLVRVRSSQKARVTVIRNFVDSIDPNIEITSQTITSLEARLEKLSDIYNEFLSTQLDIDSLFNAIPDAQLHERGLFDDSYFLLDSRIREIIRKHKINNVCHSSRHSTVGSSTAQVKLPKITLPGFGGKLEDWLEFRDTYESLIHTNGSINNIEKFHYLRSLLTGDPSLVISSLEISNNAYIEAWKLLCNRYNNPKILIHNHVKSIFSFESMQKESACKIRHMLDNLSKHLAALKILQEPTENWDTLIVHLLTSKLDSATSREWEEKHLSKQGQTSLKDLVSFLENKANVLESVYLKRADKPHHNNNSNNHNNSKQKSYSQTSRTFVSTNESISCSICNLAHSITQCESFLKLSPHERLNKARELRLCINCLQPGHQVSQCSSGTCRKCGRRHNTALHFGQSRFKPNSTSSSNSVALNAAPQVPLASSVQPTAGTSNGTSTEIVSSPCQTFAQVVLATAQVAILDSDGRTHIVRALLDSCSQSSFITEELVNRLGISASSAEITLFGIKECKSMANKRCCIHLQSLTCKYSLNPIALVLPKITVDLPTIPIDTSRFDIPAHLRLADPQFYQTRPIDILIGADYFWNLLSVGQHQLGRNLPIMQKTRLGWIISGPLNITAKNIVCNVNVERIENQLLKFWELEEFPNQKPHSDDEKQCEQTFLDTTTRSNEGRFIVKLPLRNIESLGESFDIAMKRFLSLERKLSKNSVLRTQYVHFIQEYIALGHMKKVSNPVDLAITPTYYLPHHAVTNPNSSTTRLRVVFDGSSQTCSGASLNDCQIVGPVIQQDLFSILLRFRKHPFVATADVAKMYRQVLVAPQDTPLQRILWRDGPNQAVDVYELQTVTYGTASASFLSIRCLHALADEIKQQFPHIAHRIKSDFYVDDLITGADSIDTLTENCNIISKTLSTGCFELHKWRSNCELVLSKCGKQIDGKVSFDTKENCASKTLGLIWCSSFDSFSFEIGIANPPSNITKRSILSKISQIFDPLGLLAPCTIIGKMLLQKLWLEKLSWDASVPACIHTKWFDFATSMTCLNKLCIPRFALGSVEPFNLQLHGFCDASELAYGACLYVRSASDDGSVSCSLLCAKSRVAPLKTISIPRLELCAANLLVKLTTKVLSSIETTFQKIYLWSDSTVVLGWIKIPPYKLKTFVSNRVSNIQNLSNVTAWRHVPTKSNPADLVSRGIFPNEILNCRLWWSGPDWLSQSDHSWPTLVSCTDALPELKLDDTLAVHGLVVAPVQLLKFEDFSTMHRLVRVIGYMFRFVRACRKQPKLSHVSLSLDEIRDAELFIVKSAQGQTFADEIKYMAKTNYCQPNSRLRNLNPFLDAGGLLRVGGRLDNSSYGFDQKHPILLPNKHHITKLIFEREHLRLLHAGSLNMLNSIRLKYWPLGGRTMAKRVVHRCKVCFRANPQPFSSPLMGNLPTARVIPSLPFSNCGVDYAGPIELKISHLRNAKTYKAYIALFVCLSTKAVHLELVTSLTADAFVATLRRFCARRGAPSHMYSDNGTNFTGANKELKAFFKQNGENIASDCARENFHWHFIPPRSPHFGGLWEAGVKAAKHHLKRVVGDQVLTYENYCTLLAQVEAILNSRPLSPLSSDPNDFSPLTPGHFLIGRSLNTIIDTDVLSVPTNRLSKFQLLQAMAQNFWKRWRTDYLNTLQQRTKWKKENANPNIGQLVIVIDKNTPVLNWVLGRIIALHPGPDAITRVVTVRTTSGTFKRTLHQLCPLPSYMEDKEDEQHVAEKI